MRELLTFFAAFSVAVVGLAPIPAVLWLSERLAHVQPEPKHRHRPVQGRHRAVLIGGGSR